MFNGKHLNLGGGGPASEDLDEGEGRSTADPSNDTNSCSSQGEGGEEEEDGSLPPTPHASSGRDNGGAETPAGGGGGAEQQLREACDFCSRRKRKCNGKKPCHNCTKLGVGHTCHYSIKQRSGRKKRIKPVGEAAPMPSKSGSAGQQQRQQAPQAASGAQGGSASKPRVKRVRTLPAPGESRGGGTAGAPEADAKSSSRRYQNAATESSAVAVSQTGCEMCHRMLVRCSGGSPCANCISADCSHLCSPLPPHLKSASDDAAEHVEPSPLTAASIGLQEDSYICTYFVFFGRFWRITSEEAIRQAVVELVQMEHAKKKGGAAVPITPISAVCLWCAIAIGALLQGRPLDEVRPYLRMARRLVQVCSAGSSLSKPSVMEAGGVQSAAQARPIMMLSILLDITGDTLGVEQHLASAMNKLGVHNGEEARLSLGSVTAKHLWDIHFLLGSAVERSREESPFETLSDMIATPTRYDEGSVLPLVRAVGMSELRLLLGLLVGANSNPTLRRQAERAHQLLSQADSDFRDTTENCPDLRPCALAHALVLAKLGWLNLCLGRVTLGGDKVEEALALLRPFPGWMRSHQWGHMVHLLACALVSCSRLGAYGDLRASYNTYRHPNQPEMPPPSDLNQLSSFCRTCRVPCTAVLRAYQHLIPQNMPPTYPTASQQHQVQHQQQQVHYGGGGDNAPFISTGLGDADSDAVGRRTNVNSHGHLPVAQMGPFPDPAHDDDEGIGGMFGPGTAELHPHLFEDFLDDLGDAEHHNHADFFGVESGDSGLPVDENFSMGMFGPGTGHLQATAVGEVEYGSSEFAVSLPSNLPPG